VFNANTIETEICKAKTESWAVNFLIQCSYNTTADHKVGKVGNHKVCTFSGNAVSQQTVKVRLAYVANSYRWFVISVVVSHFHFTMM
jgi:hypothetical protein